MKKLISMKAVVFIAFLALILVGCSNNETVAPETTNQEETEGTTEDTTAEVEETEKPTEVEITDAHGTVTVPVNPGVVVALDSRTYETLDSWGIEIAAAPKPLLADEISYKTNDAIQDVGNHREPNLEVIAAVNPDLVIVGQRFGGFYEEIVALVPDAVVIDLNIDTSEDTDTAGENLVNGFRDYTIVLGQIFDKNEEAAQIVADFDLSIENARAAYNGTDTIMSIIVSGGEIRFAAPSSGRVWGPLYEIFGWVSSLDVDGASSDHQGDDISIEAIAQSNPDWIFVMDRDAMNAGQEGVVPAHDVISNSPALQNITAITSGNVFYAPDNIYTNETIQSFTALFNDLAAELSN